MAGPAAAVVVAGEAWQQRHRIFAVAAGVGGGVLGLMLAAVTVLSGPGTFSGTGGATVAIPAGYAALYVTAAAQQCPGMPWTLLAAVGGVESGNGANMGPSSAGALGPMQFLPATFAEYAPGAAPAAIMDPAVAIPAAARDLCANGVLANPQGALAAYGAAADDPAAGAAYASAVLQRQRDILAAGAGLLGAPGITLSPDAALDAATARLDPRLVTLLETLGQASPITVGTLITGHSTDVAGTDRVSNHVGGRAADITTVAGQAVTPTNLAAHQLVEDLAAMQPPERPDEVGSPFADVVPSPRWFPETDHIHVGYDG